MKKRFIPVVLAALLSFGAAGCDGKKPGPEPTPTPSPATQYTVSITNKQAILDGTWSVGNDGPTLDIATNPQANVMSLINDGTIQITSSNEAVATILGRKVVLVAEGKTTISVKAGESVDSFELDVLAYIDPIQNKPEMVTTPVSGTAYKLGLAQYGLSTPSMLYLSTTVIPGGSYYWLTTPTFGEAIDVIPEEVDGVSGDYHWTLKVHENDKDVYLGLSSSGTHVNDTNESTPTTMWKWDAEHSTFLTYAENEDKGNGDYYLGTSGIYNTLSFSNCEKYMAQENSWISHLYVIPEEMMVSTTEYTLLTEEFTTAKISVAKPQGDLTFTIKEGDSVTVDAEGNLEAVKEGVTVITVSDTKTEVEVTVTVRAPEKGEVSTMPLTGAEAIAKAAALDGSKKEQTEGKYYIEDTISDNPTADYCNFHYADGSSEIVVYGLWTTDGSQRYGTKRDNIQPGFFAGDKVKVYGNLQNYSGTLEITNARLQGYEHQEVAVTAEVEHATVTGLPESGNAMNGSTVSFTITPDTDYEVVSVTVYGQTLTETEGSYSFVVKGAVVVTIVTRDTTGGGSTTTLPIALSIEGGTKASEAQVIVGSTTYDAIKCGTSSAAGAMLIKVPTGALSVSFYAGGWKSETTKLTVTGLSSSKEIALVADDGISSNSPFTLAASSDAGFLQEITFASALTEELTLTLTATTGKRFVVWNASYTK